MNQEGIHQLREWLMSLKGLHQAHWEAARYYEQRNFLLGLLSTVLAAISGVAAFATLAESPSVIVRTFIGVFSIAAASLASLQTYFRSSEQAERHKAAGVKYGGLRREMEESLIFVQAEEAGPEEKRPQEEKKQQEKINAFLTRWNAIDEESPAIPEKLYKQAKKVVRRELTTGLKSS